MFWKLVSDFVVLYASLIPITVFFHILYDRQDLLKETFLLLLPYNFLFFAVQELTMLVPDEFTGMLIKTIACRILYVFFFAKRLKKPFLTILFQSYIVSVLVAFSQLFLSAVVDLSYFTGYLSVEKDILADTMISLTSTVIETTLVIITLKLFRKSLKELRIPARYTFASIVSIIIVAYQGAVLLYLNTTDTAISPVIIGGILLLTVINIALSLFLFVNEAGLQKTISQLPVFISAGEHLNRQLTFLERQKKELSVFETALHEYKKTADLSVSVNPLFQADKTYTEFLYTDNPAVNTLLLYYSDYFSENSIPFQFEFRCSTYTGISDYLLIYLFSGLLEAVRQSVTLSFQKNANIYSIEMTTSKKAAHPIIMVLESLLTIASDTEITYRIKDRDNELHLSAALIPQSQKHSLPDTDASAQGMIPNR